MTSGKYWHAACTLSFHHATENPYERKKGKKRMAACAAAAALAVAEMQFVKQCQHALLDVNRRTVVAFDRNKKQLIDFP